MANFKKIKLSFAVFGRFLAYGVHLVVGLFASQEAWAVYSGSPSVPVQITVSNYVDYGFSADNYVNYLGYYAISNAEELYGFGELVNGKDNEDGNRYLNAVLTQNILVNDTANWRSWSSVGTDLVAWKPICNYSNSYKGTFDGANHTISGLYINVDEPYVGLFGALDASAYVKNIGILSSYINGQYSVGAICGSNGGNVENCFNSSRVFCFSPESVGQIGGLCGTLYAGHVANCYNTGEVNASGVTSVGGVCGACVSEGKILNCYNTGSISGGQYVGGICGDNKSSIGNSFNIGEVFASYKDAGGMYGKNTGTVSCCCYLKSDSNDSDPNAKTLSQFLSGEVTYLLQGNQTDQIWGQKISADVYLKFGKDTVYSFINCNGAITYTNISKLNGASISTHNFEKNGFCCYCDGFEPATDSNADGIYEIANAGQLYWFANFVNEGNITANAILTDDILVNDTAKWKSWQASALNLRKWTPIGDNANPYKGSFNGNGKSVSGLFFADKYSSGVGLFGVINFEGSMKNVRLLASYFDGSECVGGLCGKCMGTITDCKNEATVSGLNDVGGICGLFMGSNISKCVNKGAVSANNNAAGITGNVLNGGVSKCMNEGPVFCSRSYAGGVCGLNSSMMDVEYCSNVGVVSGYNYVGGIVGEMVGAGVSNCFSLAQLTATGDPAYVGGICGSCSRLIFNCYCNGDVNVCGDNRFVKIAKSDNLQSSLFKNGFVAYLLQNNQTDEVWGQNLASDTLPVLGGLKLYGVGGCPSNPISISNVEPNSDFPLHVFVNGFCNRCSGFESATDSNTDGVFEIANAGQLCWFANLVNEGNATANAILTDDILVNDTINWYLWNDGAADSLRVWTPIGTTRFYSFDGNFNGNGHTVAGIFCNRESDNVGLFGYTDSDCNIENVGVQASYIKGRDYVGGLCGNNNGNIEKCFSIASVSAYAN